MKDKQTVTPFLLILLLLVSPGQANQTFALHHMPEQQVKHLQQQHASSYVIYHNMRNLHFEQRHHALHLAATS